MGDMNISRQMMTALNTSETRALVTKILADGKADGADKTDVQKLKEALTAAAKANDGTVDETENKLIDALDNTGWFSTSNDKITASLTSLNKFHNENPLQGDPNAVDFKGAVNITLGGGLFGGDKVVGLKLQEDKQLEQSINQATGNNAQNTGQATTPTATTPTATTPTATTPTATTPTATTPSSQNGLQANQQQAVNNLKTYGNALAVGIQNPQLVSDQVIFDKDLSKLPSILKSDPAYAVEVLKSMGLENELTNLGIPQEVLSGQSSLDAHPEAATKLNEFLASEKFSTLANNPQAIAGYRKLIADTVATYQADPSPANYAKLNKVLYENSYVFESAQSSNPNLANTYKEFKQNLMATKQQTDMLQQSNTAASSFPSSTSNLSYDTNRDISRASSSIASSAKGAYDILQRIKQNPELYIDKTTGKPIDTTELESIVNNLIVVNGEQHELRDPNVSQAHLDQVNQLYTEMERLGLSTNLGGGTVAQDAYDVISQQPGAAEDAGMQLLQKSPELVQHAQLIELLHQPGNERLLEAVKSGSPAEIEALFQEYNSAEFSKMLGSLDGALGFFGFSMPKVETTLNLEGTTQENVKALQALLASSPGAKEVVENNGANFNQTINASPFAGKVLDAATTNQAFNTNFWNSGSQVEQAQADIQQALVTKNATKTQLESIIQTIQQAEQQNVNNPEALKLLQEQRRVAETALAQINNNEVLHLASDDAKLLDSALSVFSDSSIKPENRVAKLTETAALAQLSASDQTLISDLDSYLQPTTEGQKSQFEQAVSLLPPAQANVFNEILKDPQTFKQSAQKILSDPNVSNEAKAQIRETLQQIEKISKAGQPVIDEQTGQIAANSKELQTQQVKLALEAKAPSGANALTQFQDLQHIMAGYNSISKGLFDTTQAGSFASNAYTEIAQTRRDFPDKSNDEIYAKLDQSTQAVLSQAQDQEAFDFYSGWDTTADSTEVAPSTGNQPVGASAPVGVVAPPKGGVRDPQAPPAAQQATQAVDGHLNQAYRTAGLTPPVDITRLNKAQSDRVYAALQTEITGLSTGAGGVNSAAANQEIIAALQAKQAQIGVLLGIGAADTQVINGIGVARDGAVKRAQGLRGQLNIRNLPPEDIGRNHGRAVSDFYTANPSLLAPGQNRNLLDLGDAAAFNSWLQTDVGNGQTQAMKIFGVTSEDLAPGDQPVEGKMTSSQFQFNAASYFQQVGSIPAFDRARGLAAGVMNARNTNSNSEQANQPLVDYPTQAMMAMNSVPYSASTPAAAYQDLVSSYANVKDEASFQAFMAKLEVVSPEAANTARASYSAGQVEAQQSNTFMQVMDEGGTDQEGTNEGDGSNDNGVVSPASANSAQGNVTPAATTPITIPGDPPAAIGGAEAAILANYGATNPSTGKVVPLYVATNPEEGGGNGEITVVPNQEVFAPPETEEDWAFYESMGNVIQANNASLYQQQADIFYASSPEEQAIMEAESYERAASAFEDFTQLTQARESASEVRGDCIDDLVEAMDAYNEALNNLSKIVQEDPNALDIKGTSEAELSSKTQSLIDEADADEANLTLAAMPAVSGGEHFDAWLKDVMKIVGEWSDIERQKFVAELAQKMMNEVLRAFYKDRQDEGMANHEAAIEASKKHATQLQQVYSAGQALGSAENSQAVASMSGDGARSSDRSEAFNRSATMNPEQQRELMNDLIKYARQGVLFDPDAGVFKKFDPPPQITPLQEKALMTQYDLMFKAASTPTVEDDLRAIGGMRSMAAGVSMN